MSSEDQIWQFKKFLDRTGEIYKIKQGLFAQIGRAVVALSQVEYNMLVLFEMINIPMSDKESLDFFREVGLYKQRFMLIDYAVRSHCNSEEIEEWQIIVGMLKENVNVRNFCAHYNVELAFDTEQNPISASLKRPPFSKDSKKKNETVEKDSITLAANALEKAAFRINELTIMVVERRFPGEIARSEARNGSA